ncbi:MAG: SurA N-terminal domain-containing protein [Pseudomonadota bacterium]
MLDSMRRLSTGLISKIILLFIVITFVVWGIGDILRTGGPTYAAKIGDETIGIAEFQRSKAMMARQLEAMGMQGIDTSRLDVAVLRQLIQQRLTLLALKDMGLHVNEQLLAKNLRSIPELQNKDGSFNKTAFAANLQNQQINEAMFLAQLKKDTAGRFLGDSLSMDDATPPASVMALDAVTSGETRDAVLITIPARVDAAEVTEQALKDYYEQHKAVAYLQPESRTLEYVTLTPAQLNTLVEKSVTEDMFKEALAAANNPSINTAILRKQLEAEQRDSVMRTLTNTVEDELAAGKSIGEAFSTAGVTAEPHLITNITAATAKASNDDIIKTASEQGFSLSEGEISGLISTPKGISLMVAVKAVTPASPSPFEAVKADVRTQLIQQGARDAAQKRAIEVKEALAKEPNWQAATGKLGISTRAVSNLTRPVEGKPSRNDIPLAIQQSVFEHPVGDVAGPLALPNGDQLLALITDTHHPKIDITTLSKAQAGDQSVKLSQEIQAHAFTAFAKAHAVKVNPAVMQQAGQP